MTTKDGGPAFPAVFMEGTEAGTLRDVVVHGMSLRDWFAGQALGHIPALLAVNERNKSVEHVAEWAYCVADAMLSAREKGNK